jgi:hypothetical protein
VRVEGDHRGVVAESEDAAATAARACGECAWAARPRAVAARRSHATVMPLRPRVYAHVTERSPPTVVSAEQLNEPITAFDVKVSEPVTVARAGSVTLVASRFDATVNEPPTLARAESVTERMAVEAMRTSPV